MQVQTIGLLYAAPGQSRHLTVLRFGRAGSGPKAMIQAALHADEVPPMLVAQQLREQFSALDAAGQVIGEIVLVPYANPIGLGQEWLGQHQGRFDLRDGVNFNRHLPDLSAAAATAVAGQLGSHAADNVACVRQALREAAARLAATHPAEDLKNKLLALAIDADIVLDLHCDAEAVLHLYALTPQLELAAELGALLGAEALLLATESGDSPFDEACSRPWFVLRERFPAAALPLACFSTTVELRGAADTDHTLARQDAGAIIEFLRRRGVVAGAPGALPPSRCQATPLAGSEPIIAPRAGIVVFHARPGERVEAGGAVADLVDVDTGAVQTLCAQSAGVLYARNARRWAAPGDRRAKIAGTALARTGRLLSP